MPCSAESALCQCVVTDKRCDRQIQGDPTGTAKTCPRPQAASRCSGFEARLQSVNRFDCGDAAQLRSARSPWASATASLARIAASCGRHNMRFQVPLAAQSPSALALVEADALRSVQRTQHQMPGQRDLRTSLPRTESQLFNFHRLRRQSQPRCGHAARVQRDGQRAGRARSLGSVGALRPSDASEPCPAPGRLQGQGSRPVGR